jgi:hypothetical protein
MTPTPARHDLFTTAHKGVRHALFQAASLVARTDFEDDTERATAQDVLGWCLRLLRGHADLEDAIILPALQHAEPALFASLAAEHTRLEQAAIDVESLLPRIAAAAHDRAVFGAELQRRCNTLVAEHLRHMGREEREVNAALWAHHDDAALRALHARIVAAVPDAERGRWHELLLSAVSAPERRILMAATARAA